MTAFDSTPCGRGITAQCFRAHPQWAKQAFATRLLHAIAPKQITKRLPRRFRRALVVPGVTLPVGVTVDDLPPATIITPETEFPGVWTPSDPLPVDVVQPPTTAPEEPGQAVTAPVNVAPGASLPLEPTPSPPALSYYLQESFANLTANSWTDLSMFGGSAACVSGNLRLHETAGGGQSAVRRVDAVAWPTNWTATWSQNYVTGTGVHRVEFMTGTYRARITFTPPTTVGILPISGSCNATISSYINSWITWSLEVTDNLATLKQDGVPIITNCNMFASGSSPRQMEFRAYNVHTVLVDYLNIARN